MSIQKNDQSDFDFSIIDKKPPQQGKLNFSVESLLSQHQLKSHLQEPQAQIDKVEVIQVVQTIKQNDDVSAIQPIQHTTKDNVQMIQNGSFLQDLQKLEHSLSFQSQLYNVYQQETSTQNYQNPTAKSYIIAKSNSYLKTTKQQSNPHTNTQQPTNSITKSSHMLLLNLNLNQSGGNKSCNRYNDQYNDYGYLVLDFTSPNKKRKKSKFPSNGKLIDGNKGKIKRMKSQKSSAGQSIYHYGESSNEQTKLVKQNYKNSQQEKSIKHKKSLTKLFSPNKKLSIKNKNLQTQPSTQMEHKKLKKSHSKNKLVTTKISRSKSPTISSQTIHSQKFLSVKSPLKKLKDNSSRSTAICQNSSKSKSSVRSIKTSKGENAYSQYYGGGDDLGISERFVSKSNCISSRQSHQGYSDNKKKKSKAKSISKSRSKDKFNQKQIHLRFKKKKAII